MAGFESGVGERRRDRTDRHVARRVGCESGQGLHAWRHSRRARGPGGGLGAGIEDRARCAHYRPARGLSPRRVPGRPDREGQGDQVRRAGLRVRSTSLRQGRQARRQRTWRLFNNRNRDRSAGHSLMLKLDHLVINTRFDTDAAQRTFEQLGFTVTPRGYHTLGSLNHAIVFDDHYLELIGLPADGKTVRQEIVSSPLGADGLVFRTYDPAATFDTLRRAGFDATPPQTFSRPVEPHGDARFATVR